MQPGHNSLCAREKVLTSILFIIIGVAMCFHPKLQRSTEKKKNYSHQLGLFPWPSVCWHLSARKNSVGNLSFTLQAFGKWGDKLSTKFIVFSWLLTALQSPFWLCFGPLQCSPSLVLSHSPRQIQKSRIALRSDDLSQSVALFLRGRDLFLPFFCCCSSFV